MRFFCLTCPFGSQAVTQVAGSTGAAWSNSFDPRIAALVTLLSAVGRPRRCPVDFSGKLLSARTVNTTDLFFLYLGINFFIYPTYEFLLLNPLQFTSKTLQMNIRTFPRPP